MNYTFGLNILYEMFKNVFATLKSKKKKAEKEIKGTQLLFAVDTLWAGLVKVELTHLGSSSKKHLVWVAVYTSVNTKTKLVSLVLKTV